MAEEFHDNVVENFIEEYAQAAHLIHVFAVMKRLSLLQF